MGTSFYTAINTYLRQRPRLAGIAVTANRWITLAVFITYPMLMICLFASGVRDTRFLVLPAASFVGVTIARKLIGKERPYEALPVTPLSKKDTVKKSFPSRHVFSAFMIAMTALAAAAVFPGGDARHAALLALAVLLFVLSAILAVLRVLLGVHYVSDVAAGTIIALLCGFLFFR